MHMQAASKAKDLEWLDDMLLRAQSRIVTRAAELTPAIAEALIGLNPGNRTVSAATVEKYARDMAAGAWAANGESIIISRCGLLNDGQHRCAAVIMAGVTIPAIFVAGVERETRTTVDQGKARTAADYLSMNGHKDAHRLSAAAKYIWQFGQRNELSQQTHFAPTKIEVMQTIDGDPSIAASLAAVPKKGAETVGGRSVLTFARWAMSRRSGTDDADDFISALVHGHNLAPRDPILYARNRLLAEKRLTPNEKAELIFRAWNAHRRGQSVATLPIKGGPLPRLER